MEFFADWIFNPNRPCFSPNYRMINVVSTSVSHYPKVERDQGLGR